MPIDDTEKSRRVHFGLDLTYACNYRCPYCELPPVQKHRTVEEWLKAWRRVRARYGRCHIYMSGGEPSVYPGFYDLVPALAEMHSVDVCTNLSWDVERLVPRVGDDALRISATFHPTQVDFEDFLRKALVVREYLPWRVPERRSIYFVADPRQMDRMEEYQGRLSQCGLALVPLPLMVHDAPDVPANSEEEKRRIAEISPNKGAMDRKLEYQLSSLSPRGRLCRAGQRYAMIRGDGLVDRCTRYQDRRLGDFFSDDFKLWEEPAACSQDWCPFESQWLVGVQEGRIPPVAAG